jgi:hypothetical protein
MNTITATHQATHKRGPTTTTKELRLQMIGLVATRSALTVAIRNLSAKLAPRVITASVGKRNLKASLARKHVWANKVMRIIEQGRKAHATAQQIADQLKVTGITRYRGGIEWTASNIAQLWQRYGKGRA